MSYEAAIRKAWDDLAAVAPNAHYTVRFFGDTYTVDRANASVAAAAANAAVKDSLVILLLHYLVRHMAKPYTPTGEWVSFKELDGGDFYYPAFHKGVIETLVRAYTERPEQIMGAARRLGGKIIAAGDAALELATFDNISVRVVFWQGDEEFAPEATILFDRAIAGILSTEDTVVLSHMLVGTLLR